MFNPDRNCTTPAFILPSEQVKHHVNLALLLQESRVREGKIRRKNNGCLREKFQPSTYHCYILDSIQPNALLYLLPGVQIDLRELSRSC
jgi:hypothetical protein